jgi:hypothetical protein
MNYHEVSGFCIYTVAHDPKFSREPVVYSDENAMQYFWDALLKSSNTSAIEWIKMLKCYLCRVIRGEIMRCQQAFLTVMGCKLGYSQGP